MRVHQLGRRGLNPGVELFGKYDQLGEVTMDYAECPGCLTDLRVPPIKELAQLGSALSESAAFTGIELRCKLCGTHFRLPSENAEEDRRQELGDILDRLIQGE